MSYLQVKKDIDNGKIKPIYFMYGSQSFLMDDVVQAIVRKVLGSTDDSNVITYSIQDTLLDLAIEEAETFPFLGGKKVVIVKEFNLVTSQKQEAKMDHDLDRLEQYLSHPSSESVLIVQAPYEKLDERKKITKSLKKTTVVECVPFDVQTTNQWLEDQAQQKQMTITKEAKEHLVERVGVNLLQLASEMEKLSLYVGSEGVVNEDIIDLLVARSLEQDVFALIDFAVKQRLDEALVIYHDLLKQKEEPLKILALIARQLRIFYQIKEMSRQSYSQKQMAGQLKLHPYVVKLASQQMNRFEDKFLLELLEAAADTDFAIKSGKMDKVLAVELLLMKLASRKKHTIK
ncbi:DNA polymerase III subunit delta [Bacillus suaedae]|uniref:DNA polymerase III subunit delta n=1 Tax=Halalkalibacter suaedae TaxID=2822140 RepID=A0A941AN72_9BACI|nr:DNA polymerase III subunit delta [Bacillus suaedae]MBP3951325.1 DNA polymerase III subunit delta [Bacillus suaedae]